MPAASTTIAIAAAASSDVRSQVGRVATTTTSLRRVASLASWAREPTVLTDRRRDRAAHRRGGVGWLSIGIHRDDVRARYLGRVVRGGGGVPDRGGSADREARRAASHGAADRVHRRPRPRRGAF